MARITDPAKLENIKRATVSMIVENGYGGATISAIATKAGVAGGYLYRHYQSKDKLVKDLFIESARRIIDFIQKEINEYISFPDFIAKYHKGLVDIINREPDNTKFFIQLINDFAFDIEESAIKEEILDICQQIFELGRKNNEISESTTIVDVYTIMIIIPLQTFSFYMRGFFGPAILEEANATMVTHTCLKIING